MRIKIFLVAALTVSLFGCATPMHRAPAPAPTPTAAPIRHTPRTEPQRRVMATRVALAHCHHITDDTRWEDCLTAAYREQTGHTLSPDEYTSGTDGSHEFFQVDAPTAR